MSITSNELRLEFSTFPAGETFVKAFIIQDQGITIRWDYESDVEIMQLLQIATILDSKLGSLSDVTLLIPYFPHARMDRQTTKNTAFSLSIMAGILAAIPFKTVITYDIHSDVVYSILDNFVNIEQHILAEAVLLAKPSDYIVSPDKGAKYKAQKVAKALGIPLTNVIYAAKVRDPSSGTIVATEVADMPDIPTDCTVFVVDDICDGGHTFVELSKVLNEKYPTNKFVLYTTHGIYSKGLDELLKHYDAVLCYNKVGKGA